MARDMTIDEIEQLAQHMPAIMGSDANQLARFVLRVMPALRAAERLHNNYSCIEAIEADVHEVVQAVQAVRRTKL